MQKQRRGILREPCAALSGSAVSAWRNSDAFALNANWVSCWNCPLIPLLRLCCCCSLLPCRFISFRCQWGRTSVSDREKVILIHLLPLLWLPLTLFFSSVLMRTDLFFPLGGLWYSKHSVCCPCALPGLAWLIVSCIYMALLLSLHCLIEWKLPEVQFVLCAI